MLQVKVKATEYKAEIVPTPNGYIVKITTSSPSLHSIAEVSKYLNESILEEQSA